MGFGPFAIDHGQVHELTADEVHVQIVTTKTHQEDELHGHGAADEVIISQLEHTATAFDVIGCNSAAGDRFNHVVADGGVVHVCNCGACEQMEITIKNDDGKSNRGGAHPRKKGTTQDRGHPRVSMKRDGK